MASSRYIQAAIVLKKHGIWLVAGLVFLVAMGVVNRSGADRRGPEAGYSVASLNVTDEGGTDAGYLPVQMHQSTVHPYPLAREAGDDEGTVDHYREGIRAGFQNVAPAQTPQIALPDERAFPRGDQKNRGELFSSLRDDNRNAAEGDRRPKQDVSQSWRWLAEGVEEREKQEADRSQPVKPLSLPSFGKDDLWLGQGPGRNPYEAQLPGNPSVRAKSSWQNLEPEKEP